MTGLSAIFWLWLPLAVSFELMWLEGPALQSAIGRLPDASLHLAAWGLTMSLSLLIESPVIMLLATSIALVRDAASYRVLRAFTVTLCVAGTVLTALVAFTPLFGVITGSVMGLPSRLVAASAPAMAIMLLWTAAIGWRRFYQGILVRHGRTRLVSWGTLIRLVCVVTTAVCLVRGGWLPGVQVAATALMAGVITEALVTTLFVRPVVRERVLPVHDSLNPALTWGDVARFHLPLAATTMLTLTTQPLTATALARLPHPEEMLAAWPVAFSTLMVIGGWGFALQEITIAQGSHPEARPVLKRFAWIVGLVMTVVLVIVSHSPLLGLWLGSVIHAPEALHPWIRAGVTWGSLYPLLTALLLWSRGLLVMAGATKDVYRCMSLGLAALIAMLTLSVVAQVPGVVAAGGSYTVAALVELAGLRRRARALDL